MMKSVTYLGVVAVAFGLATAEASAQGRGRAQGSTSPRVQPARPGTGQARAETRDARTDDRSIADILLGRERDARRRGDRDRNDTRDRSIADILLGRDRRDRGDDRYGRGRNDDDRYDDRGHGQRGPPFCRNGVGHPVHGRRWCVDKGFGLGEDRRLGTRILRLPAEPRRDRISDLLDALGRRQRG